MLALAANICFVISYIVYMKAFALNNPGGFIYPVYILPAAVYIFLSLAAAGVRCWTKEGFFKIFKKLSPATFSFLILFLAPVVMKVVFPDPHNFTLRKFELLLGASYATFIAVLAGQVIFMVNKSADYMKTTEKKLFISIFTFFMVFYFGVTLWFNYANQPTGDEPVYLLAAHSMIHDRDIDLKNNYENRDYLGFYDKELAPQEIEVSGKLYPYHPMLISFIIQPFYLAAGRFGATLLTDFVTALYMAIIFLLVAAVFKDNRIAAHTALITGLSMPVIMYANQICAESLSGLIVVSAFYMILYKKQHPVFASIILALAPWAHVRNGFLWAFLAAIFVWENRARIKETAFFLLFQAISLAALFSFNYAHFRQLIPRQTQQAADISKQFLTGINGFLGTLLDQEFGLFFYTPVYMLFLVGAWFLYRESKKVFYYTLLLIVPYYALVSSWVVWNGGGGASSRFMVAVIFIFSLFIAAVYKEAKGKIEKAVFKAAACWGLFMTYIILLVPWFRWNKGNGVNWVMKFLSQAARSDISWIFPQLWDAGKIRPGIIAAWCAVIICVNIYIIVKNKKAA